MQEKIKICQVSSVHKTFDTRIFYKVCKSLAKHYEVYYVSANAKTEIKDNINIIGVQLSTSRIKRLFELNRVLDALVKVDADIYQFHDPELIRVGVKMKELGKKVIFDSHEDVPQQILGKGYLPSVIRNIISSFYTKYEKINLKKYDALITVTPTIVERLKKINPHCVQVTNYPIIESTPEEDQRSFERNVCFFGGVTDLWCQRQIIRALEGINVKYLFAGPLDYNDYIKELEKETGFGQAKYLGIIKHEECKNLMKQCSAGLALSDYTGNMGGKIGTLGNNKLFEYMQSGIPVIATDFELWNDIIKKYNCGITVDPHNINAIRNAIDYYIEHPVEARQQGDNGRKAVEQEYNWGTQETILLNLYKAIV